MKNNEYYDRYIDGINYSIAVIKLFKKIKEPKMTVEQALMNEINKIKEVKKNPNKININ